MKPKCVTIQMKAIEQYFHVVLCNYAVQEGSIAPYVTFQLNAIKSSQPCFSTCCQIILEILYPLKSCACLASTFSGLGQV